MKHKIAFDNIRADGFVPYTDMLNHKFPLETSWTYSYECQGFIIDVIVDIERVQPIHDSYGRKSNTQFLLASSLIMVSLTAAITEIAKTYWAEDRWFTKATTGTDIKTLISKFVDI